MILSLDIDSTHNYILGEIIKEDPEKETYNESTYLQIILQKMHNGLIRKNSAKYPASWKNFESLLNNYPQSAEPKRFSTYYPETYKTVYSYALVSSILDATKEEEKKRLKQDLLPKRVNFDTINHRELLIDYIGLPRFKNQKIGLEYTARFPQYFLLWEMGTGKTACMIDTYRFWKEKREVIDHCLVIAPLTILYNWQNEINMFSNCTSIVLEGTKDNKIKLLDKAIDEKIDFIILNYETLLSLKEEFSDRIDDSFMLVIDEFTKIKNPHAQRSKALIALSDNMYYKYGLSGTPITQHAYDIWTPMRCVDSGKHFGLSYDRDMVQRFFYKDGYYLHLQAGKQTLEEISNIMYDISLRFRKEECIDIPDKTYSSIEVDLGANWSIYDRLKTQFEVWLNSTDKVTAPCILTELLRLSQCTSGFLVGPEDAGRKVMELEEQPKLNALEELFEQMDLSGGAYNDNNNHYVVIWSRFQRDVEKIYQLCSKHNIPACTLYGKDKIGERADNVNRFQDGEYRVMIGTASTGGLGINLTRANTVVYFANDYSLQNRLQSEDRVHRAGQTQKVQYIDITARKTIDVSISKLLLAKKTVADILTKDNVMGMV